MKVVFSILLMATLLFGCAETRYQQYEGRDGPLVIEGQGGTKEVINGYEIWDNGTPPRRYQVLGVVSISDFDNVFGNQRIRTALSEKIKAAAGDAAVVVDVSGGGTGVGTAFGSNGQMAVGSTMGKKVSRWQIVRYLDKK